MVRACHKSRQPLQNHPSRHLGAWTTPWSAEEMLDGQYQGVDISALAGTAHKGFLQKRLEEDLGWIVPHVPHDDLIGQRTELNWPIRSRPQQCSLRATPQNSLIGTGCWQEKRQVKKNETFQFFVFSALVGTRSGSALDCVQLWTKQTTRRPSSQSEAGSFSDKAHCSTRSIENFWTITKQLGHQDTKKWHLNIWKPQCRISRHKH